MTNRTTCEEAIALLGAFYDLSRASCAVDLGVLAGRLGWGVGRVVRVLAHAEQRGLAERARCRLTLAGLAVAVALAAEREGAALQALAQARPRTRGVCERGARAGGAVPPQKKLRLSA